MIRSWIRWIAAALALAASCAAAAAAVRFVVAERDSPPAHNDAFLIELDEPGDIVHARRLIAEGPEDLAAIVIAQIAPGSDGFNRNWTAPGRPPWSWHVTRFDGFGDFAIELCDGWPSYVEGDVPGWIANTGGAICFWGYTIVAELPGGGEGGTVVAESVPATGDPRFLAGLALLLATFGLLAASRRTPL